MGRRHLDARVVVCSNGIHCDRSAGQVTGEPFESVGFIVEDELVGINSFFQSLSTKMGLGTVRIAAHTAIAGGLRRNEGLALDIRGSSSERVLPEVTKSPIANVFKMEVVW